MGPYGDGSIVSYLKISESTCNIHKYLPEMYWDNNSLPTAAPSLPLKFSGFHIALTRRS